MLSVADQVKLDKVLARFSGVKHAKDGTFMARCCAHDDANPSTHISVKGRKIVVRCFTGCTFDAILRASGLEARDFFLDDSGNNGFDGVIGPEFDPPPTLAALARLKALPVEFLRAHGIVEARECLEFPYRGLDGQQLFVRRRISLYGKDKFRQARGVALAPYGLWRLAEFRKSKPYLILCEGESDLLTLWHHKLHALGIPGASATGCLQPEHLQGFRNLYLAGDSDDAGRKMEADLAERIASFGLPDCTVKALRLPGGVKDLSELHVKSPTTFRDTLRKLVAEAVDPGADLEPASICLADVDAEPIHWLWYPYLPAGKFTLLYGDGGIGKSYLSMALAAAVTIGAPFPEQGIGRDPGTVLLVVDEDDHGQVLRPRFDACDGDARRLFVYDMELGEFCLTDQRCMSRLSREVGRLKPTLIVVDPLVSFLGAKIDPSRNSAVRSAMNPLKRLAADHDAAVLAISHVNKAGSGNAAHRQSGSADFVNSSRSSLYIDVDPEDDAARLMTHSKHNYSPRGPSLRYRIEGDQEASRFAWAGASNLTANEVARMHMDASQAKLGSEPTGALPRAIAALRETLRDGELPAKQAEKLVRENVECSHRTVVRAQEALHVIARQVSRKWLWSLPEESRVSSVPPRERSFTESRSQWADDDDPPI